MLNCDCFFFIFKIKRLEEQFAQQLEEQEAIFGPASVNCPLPADLCELPAHAPPLSSTYKHGSTRSSLSSMSAD